VPIGTAVRPYHACAAFKEARNDPSGTPDGLKRFGRTKHNASGAKSFWLDIDVGTGKHYATQQNALDALAVFCRTLNLQPPIVVSSGSGLHVYWPLTQTLDPDTWKRYAVGLKRLCAQHDLFADPARTADISSVLRTPGTSNRKHGVARKVECDPKFLEIRPYVVEEFSVFLKHEVAGHRTSSRKRSVAERLASTVPKYAPVLGQVLVKRCGQLQELRDKRGNVHEPLWYAGLVVLAFCKDGDDLGHEWSKGYPGYTYEETQDRLDRARTLTGATTCEHFHSLNPQVCETCSHWQIIKSPISLASGTSAKHERPPADKPRLQIEDSDPDRTVAALRDILAGAARLYDRGLPVRLVVDQVQRGTVAQVMSPDALVLMAHTVCRPYVLKAKNDHTLSEVNARLPRPFAVMYLEWRGEWRLPPLNGIATAPLLQEDGTIKSAEGYDPSSGMWCERVPELAGLVPDHPTREDATTALQLIRHTFKTFCFADAHMIDGGAVGVPVVDMSRPPGRDESSFLVALLTAVCRPSLYLAPGVLLRAPSISGAGAGKGLLARCICIIAFGREPYAVTAGVTAEELEKRIAAELIEGSPALFLDNLNNTAFKSDLLASAITERPAKVRLLGKSQMVPLNSAAFVILTGNGLRVSEDNVRRFIPVDFDARTEDPESRPFKTDIRAEVTDRRRELLATLLTIWRWGRITVDMKPGLPLGSFEQWCRWVRDPLLALGCQDPVGRVSEAKERDGGRQAAADLFCDLVGAAPRPTNRGTPTP
jgi:hypothetical protein